MKNNSGLYQLWFYVPAGDKERVKSSLFKAGAGTLGRYSHCCWEVMGRGQFMPLKGSSPAIGEMDTMEYVEEYRVEMIVPSESAADVIAALLKSHPYEEPAYGIVSQAVIPAEPET